MKWGWILLGLLPLAAGFNSFQGRPRQPHIQYKNVATPVPQPSAPYGLAVSSYDSTDISLEWAGGTGYDGQLVQRCSGASCSNFSTIKDLSPASNSWEDTGLTEGTSYSYRVANYRSGRLSDWTSTVSQVTSAAPTPTPTPTVTPTPTPSPTPATGTPPAPANFTATTASTSQIDLTWDDTTGETVYVLFRCTGIDCAEKTGIAGPAADSTSTSDTGLDPGTIYCYDIAGVNGNGVGAHSNEAGDITLTPTPTPSPTPTATPTPLPTATPTATPAPGGCSESESTTGASAAWCLSEASGAVVDSVASISLSATGSPSYSVEYGAPYSGYDPGITISGTQGFSTTDSQSALAAGTGDFNIQWLATKQAMSQTPEIVFAMTTDSTDGIRCEWNTVAFERIRCVVYNSAYDYTTCTWNNTTTQAIPGTSTEHLYEVRGDRDGNLDLYIDDSLQSGGCAMTSTSGDDIGAPGFYLGHLGSGSYAYGGTIFWWRMKKTL